MKIRVSAGTSHRTGLLVESKNEGPIPLGSELFRRTRFGKSALHTDPIVCPQVTRWGARFGVEGNKGTGEELYDSRDPRVSSCLDVWNGPL